MRPGGRGIGFKLVGARELAAALNELPPRLAKSTLDRALMKAGTPMADDARTRARAATKGTGKNASKVVISKKLSRRQRREAVKPSPTTRTVYIGVRPSPVAHLIEFGSGPRWTTGVGDARRRLTQQAALKRLGFQPAYRGVMPPSPFLRPAWDGGHRKALDDLGRILGQEIERTATRLARRQARAR